MIIIFCRYSDDLFIFKIICCENKMNISHMLNVYFNNWCVCVCVWRGVPPSPHPRNAQALGSAWEWSVRELGVGPLRAKHSKRVLNVRHVVHGALNQR